MINQAILNENESESDNENHNEIERIESKVKWYNPEKGYGFLETDSEDEDIFMHFSVLDAAGCRRVEEGDTIVCDISPGRRGRQVLRVLEVKFAPREPRVSPAFLNSRSPAFDPESLEEVEGEIKWFNPLKGYGFVYPNDGGRDIFLHASVLRAAGYESLEPGVRVIVKVTSSERGREARILQVIR